MSFSRCSRSAGAGSSGRYWREISRLQQTILGPFIEADGLRGMYTYWERIRVEENCEADLVLTDDYFEFRMRKCPSLTKAMDNDAGVFEFYCDHCAGWIAPIMRRYGYHLAYDMISRTEPRCIMRVYKDKDKAEAFLKTGAAAGRRGRGMTCATGTRVTCTRTSTSR